MPLTEKIEKTDDQGQKHTYKKVFVTPQLAEEHGLSREEYALLLRNLGRKPNLVELGIFSAMWSEHCSYKSTKVWLMTLPTKGKNVIQGPGENAGVVDIGDGQAAVFKIESHNHPSFIEPYQGAATGVGGILRDVFTMGARPIANLNALRFGDPNHPKTRSLIEGVVAGIGGYGNCVGIPTVGGEVNFHPAYNGNILVNAMTVGIADRNKIFYAKAAGLGSPVVYVGAKTGRDGIHGATMSSAEFNDDTESMRPTVQVGDPFREKLLLEACLELMATDSVIGIQDMGAAGLTSSSVEMAAKGGLGMELNLDHVPCRESHMTAYEMMLSESQERMLCVLKPGSEEKAKAIFDKWELDCATIGVLTDTGRLVIKHHGQVAADIPLKALVDDAPMYERDWVAPPRRPEIKFADLEEVKDLAEAMRIMVSCPDSSSKRWIYEQYDSMVMANTIASSGQADAALVRIHGTQKALALTTDCTPRYCLAHPFVGGAQAVVESYRNICATGAEPIAWTNNLNFGNPEKREIMGQIVGCIQGMRNAGEVLEYPVVSGNCSLYNETDGQSILPTPVIGGVGLLRDISKAMTLNFKNEGDTIILIGETKGWLGSSLFLREVYKLEEGAPPPVDLAIEKKHGAFIRDIVRQSLINACHDVSDGGVALALAEMAMASKSKIGCEIQNVHDIPLYAFLFGEDQGRYVVTTSDPDKVIYAAAHAGVPAHVLGKVGGSAVVIKNGFSIPVSDFVSLNESWLPSYMAQNKS